MEPSDIAQQRDRAVDEQLGTVTPSLRMLGDVLYADYEPDAWGLRRMQSLKDEEMRAVASDLSSQQSKAYRSTSVSWR
jgi:hypothetical protein